jgi:hypothetical protein
MASARPSWLVAQKVTRLSPIDPLGLAQQLVAQVVLRSPSCVAKLLLRSSLSRDTSVSGTLMVRNGVTRVMPAAPGPDASLS